MATINPIALLAVAAGLNGLINIAGRQSPAWLRLLAGAGVGVAMVTSMREVIRLEEQASGDAVKVLPGASVDTEPVKKFQDDLYTVTGKMLNWT